MDKKPNVLLVYTGGTIGMIKDLKTDELRTFDFNHIYEHVPELERLNIDLQSKSFDQPIDSSEMHPTHWNTIAKTIMENYDHFDGFVVLHGSDTMAYTASALSFMLQGLKKPVILTGSQLPIGTIRTDGKENLITAIEIAAAKKNGEAIIQEVAVYFEYSLYRGNRCSKVSANQFEAFKSPNYNELAIAGVTINYNFSDVFRTKEKELKCSYNFSDKIGLIKLFPGMNMLSLESVFSLKHTQAIVLETYGSGNAPSDPVLQEYISNYIQKGGIILNVTQCNSGAVIQGKYQTSSFFERIGVISGRDMTTEAAITKLMYLLGGDYQYSEILLKLNENIVGEATIED